VLTSKLTWRNTHTNRRRRFRFAAADVRERARRRAAALLAKHQEGAAGLDSSASVKLGIRAGSPVYEDAVRERKVGDFQPPG